MTCPRCQGLLVAYRHDPCGDFGPCDLRALRCLQCGYITDPTMEANKALPIMTVIQARKAARRANATRLYKEYQIYPGKKVG